MVGHDREDVELYVISQLACPEPFIPHCVANRAQLYSSIGDIAKDAIPVRGTDGNEVGSCLGVVVFLQTDRLSGCLRARIVSHGDD